MASQATEKIPKGWKETTLGAVVEFQRGFDLPTQNRTKGKYPLIVSNGIDGFVSEYKVKGPGVVTGRSGTLGNVMYIKEDYWPLNTTLWIKDFKNNDEKFIYYWLLSFPFEQFNAGTGVPTLNRNHIHEVDVIVSEDKNEQRAIAAVLSSFDDKIELLREQNKTLEATAQAIFKEWFVDSRAPGVKLRKATEEEKRLTGKDHFPKNWQIGKLGKIVSVTDGTHDSPKPTNQGYLLITSRHLAGYSLDFSNAYYISEDDYEQINRRSRVEPRDVLVSMIGTVGLIYPVLEREIDYAIKNVGLIKTSKSEKYFAYIYLFLISPAGKNIIIEHLSGTTQSYVTLDSLRRLAFVVPDSNVLIKFNDIAEKILEKIHQNIFQIQTLSKIRDILLPKLMTSKLRVRI